MKATRVLYLDLDGTVRKGYDEIGKFVNKKEDVEIFDGVPELIKKYKDDGYRIVGITNQGGIALGHLSMNDLSDNISMTNVLCNYMFDKIYACTHHPEAQDKENAICWCRKPNIGNIITAANDLGRLYPGEYYPPHLSLFVGDREEDRQCAENARIPFMWAKDWRNSLNK
jgi:D-glycero-D-manno-heptose 1,7-bisphosphate phosphatase